MLILNRKSEEEIYIETPQGRITLKVIGIDGKAVKLGIDAPKLFPIYREELYRQVNIENRKSVIKKDAIGELSHLFGNTQTKK